MLSIEHPAIVAGLRQFRYGLMPVGVAGGEQFLIVKVGKEAILAARLKAGFKIYLLADGAGAASHLGVVAAFFDDHDEPIIITTALFDADDLTRDIAAALTQPEFNVYFFDEHDRELMGVRVANPGAERFRLVMADATFEPFDLGTFAAIAHRLTRRFTVRDGGDDEGAYSLTVLDHLYPEDMILLDTRPEAYRFQDAHLRPAMTELVREDPGPPQERDIAVMLGRAFPPESIYLNPFREDTGKELADVVIVTDTVMLFIEAKDSPNTALSLERSLGRKRQTIQNQIGKAIKQLNGGLSYARDNDGVVIRSAAGPKALPLEGRQLLGLVVVREMFDDSQIANSEPILAMVEELQLPIMLIDYPGFHVISLNLRTPTRFINALHDLFDFALEHGQFPKSVWNAPPLTD
jgi:hypothetical protein